MLGGRNHVLITLDSLRWDTFKVAHTPFLDSLGEWKEAYTPGTYTLPAHASFFAGKLPQVYDGTDFYDTDVRRPEGETRECVNNKVQLWRLAGPEAQRPARYTILGRNIIEGFHHAGLKTIGSGAMGWFNPATAAGAVFGEDFDDFVFYGSPRARRQIDTVIRAINDTKRNYFLFMNLGETHFPYIYEACKWEGEVRNHTRPFGMPDECHKRQRACLEFLDGQLARLFATVSNAQVVICADHGDAFGENGMWGHSFYHPKVMEVPMIVAEWGV